MSSSCTALKKQSGRKVPVVVLVVVVLNNVGCRGIQRDKPKSKPGSNNRR